MSSQSPLSQGQSRFQDSIDFKNDLQWQGSFIFKDRSFSADQIVSTLEPFLTASRIEKLKKVVQQRTRQVSVVIEYLYDVGNISAVMRSSESFGFLPFHIIERPESRYKKSDRISKGSEKWLHIHRWCNSTECLFNLKTKGYQVVVTTLQGAQPLTDIDWLKPTAIVFGNEKDGVSQEAIDLADHKVMIPMHGLTQSFNISVAAAILLYHVHRERHKLGASGGLNSKESLYLLAQYYLRSLENAESILLQS